MNLSEKQAEFLLDFALLVQYASRKGHYFTGGELHRTGEQQEIYIKEGKTKTTDSLHMKRLAVDVFLFINKEVVWDREDYKEYGDFWESLRPENRWGGNFKTLNDPYHFEREE